MTVMDVEPGTSANTPARPGFQPGNKLGKGNPHAKRVARNRSMLMQCATPAKMKRVFRALTKKACSGDVPAIQTWLAYTIGKPTEVADNKEQGHVVQLFLQTINHNHAPEQATPGRKVIASTTATPVKDEQGQSEGEMHTDDRQETPARDGSR